MHCVIGDTSNPTDVTPLTTDVTPLPPTDGKVYLCASTCVFYVFVASSCTDVIPPSTGSHGRGTAVYNTRSRRAMTVHNGEL